MKKHLITFAHQPKKVATVSLIVATVIGVAGYAFINQAPSNPYTQSESEINGSVSSSRNLSLGFLSGGRIKSVSVKAGDAVKKGDVLATLDAGNALGALMQAKAAYSTAEANYRKVINGATGAAIDVVRAAANTAQVNLDETTKQQNILAENAHKNLLNSTLVAKPDNDNSLTPPTLSGAYIKNQEGTIILNVYQAGDGGYLSLSGIAGGVTKVSSNIPQSIADTGLYIEFPSSYSAYIGTTWRITIPNQTAPNYLANYNAYQSALQAKNQAIAGAQAALDQANASLTLLVAAARPEDVATAQAQVDNALGAVQIAQAAYNNTMITAPDDGTVSAVSITPGQIAIPNSPAIEFIRATAKN